ncbi:MAG: hypothetical protein GY855_11615 [candidate division Zixibacteria bacterium]|nr:hypothetical protein [candidate division Zixibacteria bacterium]
MFQILENLFSAILLANALTTGLLIILVLFVIKKQYSIIKIVKYENDGHKETDRFHGKKPNHTYDYDRPANRNEESYEFIINEKDSSGEDTATKNANHILRTGFERQKYSITEPVRYPRLNYPDNSNREYAITANPRIHEGEKYKMEDSTVLTRNNNSQSVRNNKKSKGSLKLGNLSKAEIELLKAIESREGIWK